MTTTGSPSRDWAVTFVSQAVATGLRHLVVSPGSRSQALALAAVTLADQTEGTLSVHVAIDERTAGFFALGLAVDSGAPVAMLCTSGSAPAHYLPAMMEAHHQGVGLIAITADRPGELRGVGANQTTVQPGIFGPFCRVVFDIEAPEGADHETDQASELAERAIAWACGGFGQRPGPVHINVAFREPLSAPMSGVLVPDVEAVTPWQPEALVKPRRCELDPAPGTLVIAGAGAGSEAEQLARDLGAPLIAEVHSGAHFGPHLVVAYRELLHNPPADISRIVCVGRPTLSREVWGLLTNPDYEHVVWQRLEPEATNPSGRAHIVDHIAVPHPVDDAVARTWSGPWVAASRRVLDEQAAHFDAPPPDWEANSSENMAERSGFAREELAVFRRPLSRRSIALGVWEATWPHDRLVLASSRMIREVDRVVPGKNITVRSTRGLSGIDGQIAFSRGVSRSVAEAQSATGTVRVILGDIAFLHDAGSLLRDIGEEHWGRVHLFVVADGGGSIFDTLEAKQTTPPEYFDRVLFTPVSADVSSLAEAYGWEYRAITQFGELPEVLAHQASHLIIECRIDRESHEATS